MSFLSDLLCSCLEIFVYFIFLPTFLAAKLKTVNIRDKLLEPPYFGKSSR